MTRPAGPGVVEVRRNPLALHARLEVRLVPILTRVKRPHTDGDGVQPARHPRVPESRPLPRFSKRSPHLQSLAALSDRRLSSNTELRPMITGRRQQRGFTRTTTKRWIGETWRDAQRTRGDCADGRSSVGSRTRGGSGRGVQPGLPGVHSSLLRCRIFLPCSAARRPASSSAPRAHGASAVVIGVLRPGLARRTTTAPTVAPPARPISERPARATPSPP